MSNHLINKSVYINVNFSSSPPPFFLKGGRGHSRAGRESYTANIATQFLVTLHFPLNDYIWRPFNIQLLITIPFKNGSQCHSKIDNITIEKWSHCHSKDWSPEHFINRRWIPGHWSNAPDCKAAVKASPLLQTCWQTLSVLTSQHPRRLINDHLITPVCIASRWTVRVKNTPAPFNTQHGHTQTPQK